jgi:hypothetical protein
MHLLVWEEDEAEEVLLVMGSVTVRDPPADQSWHDDLFLGYQLRNVACMSV